MDYLDHLCDQFGLDDIGRSSSFIMMIADKTKQRPRYIVAAGILLCFALLFVPAVRNIISAFGIYIYPAYKSYKALESEDDRDDARWLTYWVVFGFLHCFEEILSTVFFFIPFFSVIRTIALTYLHMDKENGSKLLYRYAVQPAVNSAKGLIDPFINAVDRFVFMTAPDAVPDTSSKTK